jgi:hypothetical protein
MRPAAIQIREKSVGALKEALESALLSGVDAADLAEAVVKGMLHLQAKVAEALAANVSYSPKPNMAVAEVRGEFLVMAERLFREAVGMPDAAPFEDTCSRCGSGLTLDQKIDDECSKCGPRP